MDLDHLIHRESEERLRAAAAACDNSRAAHTALADLYRDRIDFRRRTALVDRGSGPDVQPPAL